jgi:hypothetical protein
MKNYKTADDYIAIRQIDGSMAYVERRPAIFAWDGTLLFSSETVSTATLAELREMRETLIAYNNRD